MNAIIHKWAFVVAFFVLTVALSSLGILAYQNRYKLYSADAIAEPLPVTIPVEQPKPIVGVPTRVTLPDIGIDLPAKKGSYNPAAQTWTLDKTHVFINTLTNPEGQLGELENLPVPLLYGHNNASILAKTRDIKPGHTLTVVTDNGYVLEYRYLRDIVVAQEESWVLDYQGPEDLMLMTCTGVRYEVRRVMFFDLVESREVTE